MVGTVTAVDDDVPAQTITFSVTGGDDMLSFTIDLSSGALRFKSGQDYELPTDTNLDNDYEVEVTADDGNGGTTTQSITVTVDDVIEVRNFTLTKADDSVDENNVYTGAAPIVQTESLAQQPVNIEFVEIGDPGNPENTLPKYGDGSTGYGKVDYSFPGLEVRGDQ